MPNPLLSILLLYRTPPEVSGYPNRDLKKFLKDFNENFVGSNQTEIELLIKLDKDDEQALELIPLIKKQPYTTKIFVYDRWEGRFSFNYHQLFLFSKINPKTKFVMTLNDDSSFVKNTIKFLDELEQYKDEKYCIFWGVPDKLAIGSLLTVKLDKLYQYDLPYNKINIVPHPIFSRQIMECMGGMWLTYIDDIIALIIYFLYKNYNICIVKILQNLIINRLNNFRYETHTENIEKTIFNIGLSWCTATEYEQELSKLQYVIDLTEQQARNIYLNIKEDGLLEQYEIHS